MISTLNWPQKILHKCYGISVYLIKPDGSVGTSIYDNQMKIISSRNETFLQINNNHTKFEDDVLAAEIFSPLKNIIIKIHPNAIDFRYLKEYRAFILHNVLEMLNGSALGIVIPFGKDLMINKIEFLLFNPSRSLAKNTVDGGRNISDALINGAKFIGNVLDKSTPYLITNLRPSDNEQVSVPKGLDEYLETAKVVSETAASISGYINNKVGEAACALGRFLTPGIQLVGSSILKSDFGYNDYDANVAVNNALKFTSSCVECFGTVSTGMLQSAAILGSSISNNSTKIVEHNYGAPAASAVKNTFDIFGNVIVTSENVNMSKTNLTKTAGKALHSNHTMPDLTAFENLLKKKQNRAAISRGHKKSNALQY